MFERKTRFLTFRFLKTSGSKMASGMTVLTWVKFHATVAPRLEARRALPFQSGCPSAPDRRNVQTISVTIEARHTGFGDASRENVSPAGPALGWKSSINGVPQRSAGAGPQHSTCIGCARRAL